MWGIILRYGVIAGLIAGLTLSAVVVAANGHPSGNLGMAFGYATMLVAFSSIFVAIKRHRDRDLGGVIGFGRALALGLGISAVAGVIYVAAWEATVAVTHLDFAREYAKAMVDAAVAKGTTGAALAQATAEAEAFRVQYANPLYRLPMTFAEIFPIGVLVSLVSAALLRNPRFLAVARV
jgi:peptidoglycan/LPS O-acetylase OafA/YrhL